MSWIKVAKSFEVGDRVMLDTDQGSLGRKRGSTGTIYSKSSAKMFDVLWDDGKLEAVFADEIIATDVPAPGKETEPTQVTKYSPELAELRKLIKILVWEGVPALRIDEVMTNMPFTTTEDVASVSAKLWSLGTEVYQIPREWLIDKMEGRRKKRK